MWCLKRIFEPKREKAIGVWKNVRNKTNWLTPWSQNLKVHHRVYNSPPLVPILSQLSAIHNPAASLPRIYSDPILLSTPRPSEWSLSLCFSHWQIVYFSLHMPRQPHSPWFDLPNNMWGWVQIIPPSWYLYFVVVVGLACLNEPESHAGGNICYQ
jgi:hypothetical protein